MYNINKEQKNLISTKAEFNKTDEELIDDFQKGDISGFNSIVIRYQEKIYWVIRRMVNNHDDADDITQEVFIKVYSALHEFRRESNLFTWLYRIAMNYSLNHIKKVKTRNTTTLELVQNTIPDKHANPDSMDKDLYQEYIKLAIEQLPPQQKAVFNMRYFDELPYEEISKIMKRSVGGIKANYFHAVKNIGNFVKLKLKE